MCIFAGMDTITVQTDNPDTSFLNPDFPDEAACCPYCGDVRIWDEVKGVSLSKAMVGGFLLGPVGTLAGFIDEGKLQYHCKNCGAKFAQPATIGEKRKWATVTSDDVKRTFIIAGVVVVAIVGAVLFWLLS